MYHSPAQHSRPPSACRPWPWTSASLGEQDPLCSSATRVLQGAQTPSRAEVAQAHSRPAPAPRAPCKSPGKPVAGRWCWAGAALRVLGSWQRRLTPKPQQPLAGLAPLTLASGSIHSRAWLWAQGRGFPAAEHQSGRKELQQHGYLLPYTSPSRGMRAVI